MYMEIVDRQWLMRTVNALLSAALLDIAPVL